VAKSVIFLPFRVKIRQIRGHPWFTEIFQSKAQAEAVAEVPIYRETRSAIICASACKKFEYFQFFLISFHISVYKF